MPSLKTTIKETRKIKDMKKRILDFESFEVAVGFPAGKAGGIKYPNGTDLIDVAFWNNYGTDLIPERRFMDDAKTAIAEKVEKKIFRKLYGEYLNGKIDLMTLLERLGVAAELETKKVIRNFSSPPNSPITIDGGWISHKGGKSFYVQGKKVNNPLVDTGLLLKSVTSEARKKKGR